MKQKEQIEHLANELDALIGRFSEEYDLSYAAVIGVLHMKIHLLEKQAIEEEEQEE